MRWIKSGQVSDNRLRWVWQVLLVVFPILIPAVCLYLRDVDVISIDMTVIALCSPDTGGSSSLCMRVRSAHARRFAPFNSLRR